jgi:2-amino-4-hydroxy-6-hydroxymethyldihydropteridine diphosphokinase
MTLALVAFGANLGPAEQTFYDLIDLLPKRMLQAHVRPSRLYRTSPVGTENQSLGQPFFNGAYLIESPTSIDDIFLRLQSIQTELGKEQRATWSPRSIDLDFIWSDGPTRVTPNLTLPHPRMHYRWFVLQPAADLLPQAQHPILNRSIGHLARRVNNPHPTFAWIGPRNDEFLQAQQLIRQRFAGAERLDCLNPLTPVAFQKLGEQIVGVELDAPDDVAVEPTWAIISPDVDPSTDQLHSRPTGRPGVPALDLRSSPAAGRKSPVTRITDFLDSLHPGNPQETVPR